MNKSKKILIVDDMNDYREMFSLILSEKGYDVFTAGCIKEAQEIIKNNTIAIVVTDLIMKDETGIELLKWIKGYDRNIGVILVTAYGTVETAVEAMKLGAYNYFIKSSNPESLLYDISNYMGQFKDDDIALNTDSGEISALLHSENKVYKELLHTCDKIAGSDISVLILGESGVGKEVIAKYIHTKSCRAKRNFLAVNCQEYSEGILESELFGHEKGAFTGAVSKKIGKFERAGNGTLFLDEIADISLNTQVKLLRVIENKKIERVGGSEKIEVNIRLISATNKDIEKLISEGLFREDFFYRINGIVLNVPPLRDRREDIDAFIEYFIKKSELKFAKKVEFIDDETKNFLKDYNYPGNIRELKTIIERLVVLSENGRIDYDMAKYYLPHYIKGGNTDRERPADKYKKGILTLQKARSDFELEYIKDVIVTVNGNLTQAAQILGITKRQLNNKITDYGIREWIDLIKQ